MSLMEEIIQDYYNRYNCLPDSQDIETYLNNHSSMFKNCRSTINTNNPENELIGEVTEIVSSVSNVVTNTVRNRKNAVIANNDFEELKHMIIFSASKFTLFWVLRYNQKHGYDFTNF